MYKMKIISVETYQVLPIPMRVQAVSLRGHRARCRPHLIKHTPSVLDAKYIKSLELYKMKIISVRTYHVLPIPKPVQAASLRVRRARFRPFLVKYTKTVLDSQPVHYKRTSIHY